MRGENKTARELWELDSAVARGYLIKVAQGLVKKKFFLGEILMFVQVLPQGGYHSSGRLRPQGLLARPALHGFEDWVLSRSSSCVAEERRQANGAKAPSDGNTRLARRGGFSIADVPTISGGRLEVRGLSPLRER